MRAVREGRMGDGMSEWDVSAETFADHCRISAADSGWAISTGLSTPRNRVQLLLGHGWEERLPRLHPVAGAVLDTEPEAGD